MGQTPVWQLWSTPLSAARPHCQLQLIPTNVMRCVRRVSASASLSSVTTERKACDNVLGKILDCPSFLFNDLSCALRWRTQEYLCNCLKIEASHLSPSFCAWHWMHAPRCLSLFKQVVQSFRMHTCSLGLSISSLISGGTPPANRIPLRLLLSLAKFAKVFAAISVVLFVEPESSNLTSRCIAPASRIAEKNWSVVDRLPTTAAALSITSCSQQGALRNYKKLKYTCTSSHLCITKKTHHSLSLH